MATNTPDELRQGGANQRAAGADQLDVLRSEAQALAAALPRKNDDDDGSAIAASADRLAVALVTTIVAHMNAAVMESEAAIREELMLSAQRAGLSDKRRLALERNDAIRRAAAQGNWRLFDELAGFRSGDDAGDSTAGGAEAAGASSGD